MPLITTITGAQAACAAIAELKADGQSSDAWSVRALQDYFPDYRTG